MGQRGLRVVIGLGTVLWPDPIWFLQSITGGILWVFWGAILSWPEHRSKSDNNS